MHHYDRSHHLMLFALSSVLLSYAFLLLFLFFFFNDTATTEIYTLSLHDALPISRGLRCRIASLPVCRCSGTRRHPVAARSEEHTSELQSRRDLVCRLLLEKKKKNTHKT